MPKVSVIIPVYNVEKYLKQCLDSVINQTLKDIEIICVDDGSTDSSLEILKEYAKNDNRIKILTQENKGAGAARNTGLRVAAGKYVYFLDSDDFLELNAFECLINYIDNREIDFCVFCHNHYDNGTKIKKNPLHGFSESEITKIQNFKDNPRGFMYSAVTPWNKLYYRDFLIKNNIFFDKLKCANDRSFYLHTLAVSEKILLLNKQLINYRLNVENSLITKRLRNFDCMFQAFKNSKEYFKNLNSDINLMLIDITLIDIFRFYNMADKNTQKIIKPKLRKFLKQFAYMRNNKDYMHFGWYDQFKGITRPIYQKILRCFLHIYNKNMYKVIKICGIKIKIKSQKLINKRNEEKILHLERLHNKLNNRLNNIEREYEYKLCKYMSKDKYPKYLKDWYLKRMGKNLNLENPKTFNEKIQWMKLYDSTPEKTRLADKYLVRDWVKEKIGEEYLIPLLGVWDRFDDINFDELPEQFVLKCNHGRGYNIIVKDKSQFNIEEARQKVNQWMEEDFSFRCGLELHYSPIPRKIIAEKFISKISDAIYDYRFFCFDGVCKQIWLDVYSGTPYHERKIYDENWNELDIQVKWPRHNKDVKKPENFDKMLELAQLMAQGFAMVRVDFYDIDNKIYFGEMTFTSMSGTGKFIPETEDFRLGEFIQLPKMEYLYE